MNAKDALNKTLDAIKNRDKRRRMDIMAKISYEADRGNRSLEIDLYDKEDIKYFESLGYKYEPRRSEIYTEHNGKGERHYMMYLPFLRW